MAAKALVSAPVSLAPKGDGCNRFSDLSKRILGYVTGKETFQVFNPEKPGPWESERDFYDSLLNVEVEVRIYSVQGHSLKFVLAEDYARIHDELRRIRLDLENPEKAEQASAELASHPYGKRALIEDFLPSVDELPDSSYFGRLMLLDDENVADRWVRQVKKDYNPNFISSAAVKANGDLLFFRREQEIYLRTDLFHEWCHRLDAKNQALEALFRKAILLEQREPNWYVPSDYALTDFAEHWAVYGEQMLSADRKVFETARDRSPVRAYIWARALTGSLDSTKSTIADELRARCSEVEKICLPKAILLIGKYLADSTNAEAKAEAEALSDLFSLQ